LIIDNRKIYKSIKRKLQVIKKKEKDYKYLFWDSREVCWWESDQRATTLSRWRCDRLLFKCYCL